MELDGREEQEICWRNCKPKVAVSLQSSLSDLEGQKRKVSDRELTALANIFGVVLEELYNKT